jgi:hypothetical protein
MPTGRELKKLLQPLLKRRPDLAFVGRVLFFVPITHYLRGVGFTISRFHSASSAVSFAHQLYNGKDIPDFGFSHGYTYLMSLDWEQDLTQTSNSLCEAMEKNALPPVQGIVDYVEHQKLPPYLCLFPDQELADSPKGSFTVALGECSVADFDAAEKRLSDILRPDPLDAVIEVSRYSGYLRGRMAYLLATLREDRTKVLPLLHDWEAHAVKGMKLTRYWKPTPFPGEL